MKRKAISILPALALGLAALGAATVPTGLARAADGTAEYSPDQAAAISEWARSLAIQTATFAAPIVGMYNLRQTVATGSDPKAKPGSLWRMPNISTPELAKESGYVTPNANTLYGFGFMDLSQEPVVLTAPDSKGRYYMIEIVDMWNNAFAYAAGKEAGYDGGKFAIVGPGWQGTLPDDVKRIDSPTAWVELQPRVHVKDQADLSAAQAVLEAITVQGLSEYEGKPGPAAKTYDYLTPKLDPNVASSRLTFVDPLQFWTIFVDAMNENPPPKAMVEAVLPSFKYLGIEMGKKWDPTSVDPLFLAEMKKAVPEIGPMMAEMVYVIGPHANGWMGTPYNLAAATTPPNADYLTAAISAVVGLTANRVDEAFYLWGQYDEKMEGLTGEKK